MKKIAQLISFVFSPISFLFITPYVVVHSQISSRLYAIKWSLFSLLFIGTGVLFILVGRVFGVFSDFDISHREERIKIYIASWILVVLYWLCALFFKGIFFPISIIAFGLVIGIFLFFIGRFRGTFSDEDVSVRKERFKFYVLLYSLGFIYFILSLFLKGIFFPLSIISFGIILGILIFNLVNYRLKASIHTGFACAFIITASILWGGNNFLKVIWILPLVIWSRLFLKKHSIKEVITGGLLGSALTFVTFLLTKFLYNL